MCVHGVCSVCNLEPSQPVIRRFEPQQSVGKLKLTSNAVKRINQYREVHVYESILVTALCLFTLNANQEERVYKL